MIDYNKNFMTSKDRLSKARKIEAVLCDFLCLKQIEGKLILDYGCGSGHISKYFSARNRVIAADVADNRDYSQRDGYLSVLTGSKELPFPDHCFDVVILNHVIEYVSDREGLMNEVQRILRTGGVCYLALPNRNFPIDTHSKLPFIPWLPQTLFFAVFRQAVGSNQQVYLVSHGDTIKLACNAGFRIVEYTSEIIRGPDKYFAPSLPLHKFYPSILDFISPTIVFVLEKR